MLTGRSFPEPAFFFSLLFFHTAALSLSLSCSLDSVSLSFLSLSLSLGVGEKKKGRKERKGEKRVTCVKGGRRKERKGKREGEGLHVALGEWRG
jgi:hypothetical protein